jgi:hypothetical protein
LTNRTIAVTPHELDIAIGALGSAQATLKLTRFQRVSYAAIMISADAVILCYLAQFASLALGATSLRDAGLFVWVAASFTQIVFLFLGAILLILNIPLFIKAHRESQKLKKNGLASLSNRLWRESRRSRWISRGREILFLLCLTANLLGLGFLGYEAYRSAGLGTTLPSRREEFWLFVAGGLALTLYVALLFGAHYLRNQRGRIDITANAKEMRKALQRLREKAEKDLVRVPTDLLERTARIESVQIAAERKDAVLDSLVSRSSGYAVAFAPTAASSRAALELVERIELDDLVAQLSTQGEQPAPSGREGESPSRLRGDRLEIEYTVDPGLRAIRITDIRQNPVFQPPARGELHA